MKIGRLLWAAHIVQFGSSKSCHTGDRTPDNQRKKRYVKRFRRVSGGLGEWVLIWGFTTAGACWGRAFARCGHGEFRAGPVAVLRRGCGARHPGLLALRSASGLGPAAGAGGPAPTAFNRAGEKVRATRGELPRVICEVILTADAGSLSPHRGEGLGHRCGCGPRSAAQAASA